jgi:predicted alpha-1,2-mannosidase
MANGQRAWGVGAATLAVGMSCAGIGRAAVLDGVSRYPAPPLFWSSFEPDDPAPSFRDTVETDSAGARKASGVDGTSVSEFPGNVAPTAVEIQTSAQLAAAGEVKENLVDGDVATKWLSPAATAWTQVGLPEAVTLVRYGVSSANDAPERDPKDWMLQGSLDGRDWKALDIQAGQTFERRLQTRTYPLTNAGAYRHYRLEITRNGGAPFTQVAELYLGTAGAGPAGPADMKSRVDAGPSSSRTAKVKVGFTGLNAFTYEGTHQASSRGYSYNKVFEVDIPVTPTTELSYLIFPLLPEGDLQYRSTFAAIDLAFADGSYLSDLGAEDQHFARLDPQSQGRSKTLYVNQWNYKQSVIGKVAAGKTIRRILVAYDNPAGGAGPFRGWIDDIRIQAAPAVRTATRPSDFVSTTRGTHSSGGFSRGNNIPATAVPNGFNFWVPVTNAGSTSWLYDYHRGNNAENLPALQAFAASHEPSPWMGDRQTFQVMPSSAAGAPDASRTGRALAFRHQDEVARPHYYGVRFQNGIEAEIVPTDHAAMFRFRFPGPDASLVFDNVNNNGALVLDPARREITGHSDVRSRLSAGATRMFVYATFDRAVVASGMLPGGGGADVTGYFRFDAGPDNVVTMKIATSLIGVEQAKRNLALQIAAADTFETIRERAQALWDEKLRIVEVEGASEDQKVTLYSNLYRLFLYPNAGHENVGTNEQPVFRYASPFSTAAADAPAAEPNVVDGKVYVNNGFWDTFRTAWPAYTLLAPRLAGELIDGFVQQYKDGGWVARWSSPGYANLMAGTSSDVAFADAYVKGVTRFDAPAAYDAAVRNAAVVPPNASVGRKGLESSIFLGYTSHATGEGTSWALDGYVNDFGIANMARALAADPKTAPAERRRYQEEHEYYLDRALNYVHMFDPSIGFFQGRGEGGAWRLPPDQYDPRVWGHDYTETNGWNFAFTVPHDGQGLANLYGGRDALAKKLDAFFSTPETADSAFAGSYRGVIHEMVEARDTRMGQYGHSNQPSHHIIYMYAYAGQPWKTQEKVREVLARMYIGSEIGQGYLGDEDNGEMAAWQIFSALGLYPLQVGGPYYAIGSPLFARATVHLESGGRLVVQARNNSPANVYVQSLKVNGKPYHKTYLPHDLVSRGAVLEFEMGPAPSKWGTTPEAAPPSITQGPEPARPLRDVTGGDNGRATAAGGADVAGLFDNTSRTRVTLDGGQPWIVYALEGPAATVRFYTLTSGDVAGDPRSWILKGSNDGRLWTTLDTRRGERFPWRLYTRPFKIARPAAYRHYRLEITETTGEPATSLAEVELLARPAASRLTSSSTRD